ncbi:MAG: NUDIX domain-containing protein [Rhodosalinus sp.]
MADGPGHRTPPQIMSIPPTLAFRPLHFDIHPRPLGAVPLSVAAHLVARGLLRDDAHHVTLPSRDPTDALEDIRDELFRCGWIEPPRGEAMAVTDGPAGTELARLDRSALRILGFWVQKVHINGLVEGAGRQPLSVWISMRSGHALSSPGKWDTLIAGGRAAGRSVAQTAAQEGWEEAGLDARLLQGLRPVEETAVTYVSDRGLHQELLIVHDLTLPANFEAVCHDGEIAYSRCLPLPDLEARLARSRDFKPGSYLVLSGLVRRLRNAGPAHW